MGTVLLTRRVRAIGRAGVSVRREVTTGIGAAWFELHLRSSHDTRTAESVSSDVF